MPGFHYSQGVPLSEHELAERIAPCATKFAWFLQNGYRPHFYQTVFHTLSDGDDPANKLCRYRHLVAGRRGGKTMSAAWEVAFYLLHPEEFHWDAHRVKDDRPLYAWMVAKDFPTGHAARVWFREVLKAAGLEHGVEYKENKGNNWFEFENGSFIHFRSAEDPESLRGAGLDIMWMDEAAFIPNSRAWEVARPALSDKRGWLITTTTPDGKNWLYKEFWSEKSLAASNQGRVEYRSIDNPYFPEEEWQELRETYHPLLFKQEYMAAFDSMAGRELSGEWLRYYENDELPRDKDDRSKLALKTYIGVDPAASLADSADRFAIACVGVTLDGTQAYLLDLWAGRIPFHEQLDKIQEFHIKWKPELIGVESVAYSSVLAQQALRIPGFLPIIPHLAVGKKQLRILSMSPLFKIGRIKIRKDHYDFIDEWLDYDSSRRNTDDDCLDAVEIAIRTTGALLPGLPDAPDPDRPFGSFEELAAARRPQPYDSENPSSHYFDDMFGAEW
jgi:phage terminase large subunit-like protein